MFCFTVQGWLRILDQPNMICSCFGSSRVQKNETSSIDKELEGRILITKIYKVSLLGLQAYACLVCSYKFNLYVVLSYGSFYYSNDLHLSFVYLVLSG